MPRNVRAKRADPPRRNAEVPADGTGSGPTLENCRTRQEQSITFRPAVGYHRGVTAGGRSDAWTLLTSHGHVLVEIVRNPHARVRDLGAAAGITERATAAIIADLESSGYITRTRVGRRNHYAVNLDLGFRHEAQRDLQVGPFLALLTKKPTARDEDDHRGEHLAE